jgi:CRP/FNR family transcriptional regulator, cyclic AMP receptor protein
LHCSEAVWVLDEDPDLARGLDDAARAEFQAHAVAPLMTLAPGQEDFASAVPVGNDDLGVLVLTGLLARNVRLAGQSFTELLGVEDLLRPRDDVTDPKSLRANVGWTVMEPTRLAVLDQRFALRVAPWLPALTPVLIERTVRRARWLTLRAAINETRRIEERLLLLLWHLADRWGYVQQDGICIPVRLTHRMLARMVCAHRSSVTTALNQLLHKGILSRGADEFFILREPIEASLARCSGAPQREPPGPLDLTNGSA